jgi:uncharacterized RDD family membrane protein YckC
MPTPEDTSQAPDNPAFVSKPAPDGYRYAGAWIRLAALIIDSLVLLPVGFALGMGIGLFLVIAYPTVNLDMHGWLVSSVVYVAMSAALLGWYGGWQHGVGATPGMLVLKLRVRDPSGDDNPSLRAAMTRNLPLVLGTFGDFSGDETIDALLTIVTLVICVAIGITISNSPTRQGFHDRLAGGTYVVRLAPGARARA